MRSSVLIALAFFALMSGAQLTPFSKVVLESNVLAVGEISSVRLSGGSQPYSLSFLLRGDGQELQIADAKSYVVAQVNTVRSSSDEVLIEFKAMKPFTGALIVRDAARREAKFDLYAGNEKLLREVGKPSSQR